ncbi:hypothetical protein OG339_16835 [Streptosporangium sp. NBC_01495]|uniref:hypothetical protein n=1 Tax=Streptosporangium sp. NBC_01495 TaxID=2903899 RepID=UPI002E349B19|nr:hypothetical protein [Streptosporangium sp. NBC_01495]
MADLAATVPAGCCLVCAQLLAAMNFTTARIRRYCSTWCSQRARGMFQRGTGGPPGRFWGLVVEGAVDQFGDFGGGRRGSNGRWSQ